MRDQAILENSASLKSVPDCYKNQQMCSKAVDNYSYVLEFVSECFMTQEVRDKAVNRCLFVSDSVSNQYKIEEMCDRVVSEDPLLVAIVLINIKLRKCVMNLLMVPK